MTTRRKEFIGTSWQVIKNATETLSHITHPSSLTGVLLLPCLLTAYLLFYKYYMATNFLSCWVIRYYNNMCVCAPHKTRQWAAGYGSQDYLHAHSFCSIDEYLNVNRE
jgi:hypothetical protein